MKRERIGQLLFLSAAALALALYALTAPDGLPWNDSTRLAEMFLGGGECGSVGLAIWGFHVRVMGGAVALAVASAALAAGLLAALANRYFGWRFASALAIVWIFLPGVWNRAITGERGMCLAAAAVAGIWALNAVALALTHKGRAAREAVQKRLVAPSDGSRFGRANRLAGWVALGAAGVFAVVSLSMHDYLLGETASAYARGVVEAADGRIIVGNGVLDEQLLRAARGKARVLILREDDLYRRVLVETVKRECPADTNLWLAARVGVKAFADEAVRKYPDRFYLMNGASSTLEQWENRWTAFSPYLKSGDPFVGVGRRLFGYEGNGIANALASTDAKAAWNVYGRIYKEIDPGNFSALVNMSELIRRGYNASPVDRKLVQTRLEAFQADAVRARHVREIARASGPVRSDPQLAERFESAARQRTAERIAAGDKVEPSPEVMSLVERNNEMVKAMNAGDIAKAGRLARTILANPDWQGFIPANAVMGTVAASEGDYAASERFFAAATRTTNAVPPVVLNDYAETLVHLERLDEAEKMARRAVAETDESFWLARLTLAEILEKKAGKRIRAEAADKVEDEIRALIRSVMTHAPAATRDTVRRDHRRFAR